MVTLVAHNWPVRPPGDCMSLVAGHLLWLVLRQIPDFDVLEPNIRTVILEQDVSLQPCTKIGRILELTLRHGLLRGLAATFVFKDLHPVQPVFHVIATDQYAGMIHFAEGFARGFYLRLQDIVETCGDPFSVAQPGVRVFVVVEELVFVTESGRAGFDHKVFDTTIATRLQFPIPFKIELLEFPLRDDVTATFTCAMKPAALHVPTLARESLLFEGTPSLGGFSVEQQLPAALRFGITECVR